MAEVRDRGELDQLRAAVARLEREVAVLRGRRGRGRVRRLLPLALVAVLVGLIPLATLAANPIFSDLGQAAPEHQPNIQAIGNAGITTGYDDPNVENPDYRLYDPSATVTREQMASFLARTAGLGSNPPVANARVLQGYAPNGLLRAAQADPFGSQTITGYFGATTYQTIATATIDAPTDGYLFVIGTAGFGSLVACTTRSECALTIRLGVDNPALNSPLSFISAESASTTKPWSDTVTTAYLFPVKQGTRSVTLQVAKDLPASPEKAYFNPRLTILFVPFGATGQTYTAP